jgi:hypothetical protein
MVYQERFQLYFKQVQEQAVADDESSGWCAGFVGTCLDAEREATDPDGLWHPAQPLVSSWPMVAETEQRKAPMIRANLSAGTQVGQISLGVVALLFDDQEFVSGMECGLEHCFSMAVSRRTVSTQELHHMLVETMIEDGQSMDGEEPSSTAFRSGFVFGWIMGRLHPNLNDMDERLSWIGTLAMNIGYKENEMILRKILNCENCGTTTATDYQMPKPGGNLTTDARNLYREDENGNRISYVEDVDHYTKCKFCGQHGPTRERYIQQQSESMSIILADL